MLAIGTFVLYDGGKIGRVLSRMSEGYQPNDSVMINEFPLVRYSTLNIRPNPSTVHHEVYQSSSITFVQEIGLIESVAWVFSPKQITNARYKLGDGVKNVFIIRFSPTTSHVIPFPSPTNPELTRSWKSPIQWRYSTTSKQLWMRQTRFWAEKAPTKAHFVARQRTLPFAPLPWTTFKSKQGSGGESQNDPARSRTETGMTKRAYGSKEDWFILRFETLGELNMLLSLFGPTILMGIRSHRVKIGGSRPILRGDRINVVMADLSPVGSSFTIRTDNRGVDMISNGRKLRLVIRYERTQEGDTAYMNSRIPAHLKGATSTSRCRRQYYTRSSVTIVYTATLLP
jgi:hypothetical protein